jgi:archaellum component FlaG (FlaF/FlaG flagellin family)
MRTVLSIVGASVLLALVGLLAYSGQVFLFNFWTQLAVLLCGLAVALLAWGFKPHFDKNVSLKIINPRKEIHNQGTEHEFKSLLFDIKNNGKVEAKGCKAMLRVSGQWNESETLSPDSFNILAKDKYPIHLCTVEKKYKTTTVILIKNTGTRPALTKGIYDLDLCIVGENFANGKTHRLKLDLSSWENIGIKLDC